MMTPCDITSPLGGGRNREAISGGGKAYPHPKFGSRSQVSTSPQGGSESILHGLNRSRGNGTESGFTLIEVLVALTILSISLGVLLAVFLQGLDRAKESSNEAAARVLAQSLLDQAKSAPSLAVGTTTGTINGLHWRMQIAPYGAAADQSAWQAIPAQFVATVTWRGDGGMRTVSLSTLKVYTKPGTGNNDDNNDDDN